MTLSKTLDRLCKANVEIWPDMVFVFGQTIKKPKSVSYSQWMIFWERVQRMQPHVE